ncbi:MAG: ribbon-helix-helix domain-containing protein [Acidobacteriota bacterium]|nr:ribbon-helix-helix domain-containing protein [Acidobacteriota bacterium]
MRTTLNLADDVTRAVKQEAAASGRTMTEVIETALRDALLRKAPPPTPFELRLPTVGGTPRPGVDLTDRDALYELMEGRS